MKFFIAFSLGLIDPFNAYRTSDHREKSKDQKGPAFGGWTKTDR